MVNVGKYTVRPMDAMGNSPNGFLNMTQDDFRMISDSQVAGEKTSTPPKTATVALGFVSLHFIPFGF